jgi:hypothetical protein
MVRHLITYHNDVLLSVYWYSLTLFILISARPSINSLTVFYTSGLITSDYLYFMCNGFTGIYQVHLASFASW